METIGNILGVIGPGFRNQVQGLGFRGKDGAERSPAHRAAAWRKRYDIGTSIHGWLSELR